LPTLFLQNAVFTAICGGQRGSAGGIFIGGQLLGDGWKIAVVKRGVPRVCVENLFHRGHRVLPLDHSSRWCVEVGKKHASCTVGILISYNQHTHNSYNPIILKHEVKSQNSIEKLK